ncbi:MAG: prolipoprotein diacylglyceryl transferase [Roseibacillus sp.]|jgi:phosphatidylglycerol:prolipoprotein diacylglycerol transferase
MGSVSGVLGVWVHNLKPEIVEITEKFALRWYGLAYLAGFVAGFFVLKWMSRRKLWVVKPEKVADFIAYAALFGVFLGGRLGYVLFYMIPEKGLGFVLENPWVVVKVWEGGMSSHGGILGLTIFAFFYAKNTKVSWPGIGDGLVIVSTLGVFFGRLANFINGELYGRATNAAWAMKFPKELLEPGNELKFRAAMGEAKSLEPERLSELWAAYHQSPVVYKGQMFEGVMEVSRDNPAILEVLAKYLEARHPSQLYQALLEGLGLCLILFVMRLRWPKMAHGMITGTFFLLYATFRIVAERFREPDSAEIVEGLVTKGQFYSFFMFAIGAGFLIWALLGKTGRLGEIAKKNVPLGN